MNGTPRLRSAFPDTPQTDRRRSPANSRYGASPATPGSASRANGTPLPPVPSSRPESSAPLIPFDTIDAASQRLYVATFYIGLWAWRLYDFYNLLIDDTESLWLFMKWIAIDGIFLFGLPALRIPWLEWSSAAMTILFLAHALLDGMLMFKIGIPITSWIAALVKLLYDREIAISEISVKPGNVLHNASLIMGRQVIHILPEGSAMLNPEGHSFCLGTTRLEVQLPIQINQTTPISIELLRIDLDSMEQEIVTISGSTARKLKRDAARELKNDDTSSPLTLRYPVKKTGYYILSKVVDESKLEVQPRRSHAAVVSCPSARVKPTLPDRCRDELSNIALEVHGTPPLKLKYRRSVNEDEAQRGSFQSLQPDDFVSPLSKLQPMSALTKTGEIDVSWAQARTVNIPLNETLQTSGLWSYDIEEVQDGLGNVISYAKLFEKNERSKIHAQDLQQSFSVHERPKLSFRGCDPRHPLRVPKGYSTSLPFQLGSTGKDGTISDVHNIEYFYTPEQDILPSGGQSTNALSKQIVITPGQEQHIQEPGLYSLSSVSTNFCGGEVLEPSSCVLQNPAQPDLSFEEEDITDKCAMKPIGKKISLDLIGTPPFQVRYSVRRPGQKGKNEASKRFDGHRGELTLTPYDAGSYEYQFEDISDAVYPNHNIHGKNLVVRMDVKPPPYARFVSAGYGVADQCIGEPIELKVSLQGEGPWDLEYEIIHAGKRTKYPLKDIQQSPITIVTDKVNNGGDYTISLSSVTDSSGCKEYPKEEAKISVRHQRPKGGFAPIEGKYSVKALQGKRVSLPVRLTGEPTWTVAYQHLSGASEKVTIITMQDANDFIDVVEAGTYKLMDIKDHVCPGTVDTAADSFNVTWLEKPKLHVTDSELVTHNSDTKYTKNAVCEGDEDSLDLSFSGSPPFKLAYEEHRRPTNGAKSMRKHELPGALGLASIQMDTTQAGEYEYKFTQLSDYNYDHDSRDFTPMTVSQKVYSRPSARFANPGKTYSYCASDHEEASETMETIPIKLIGEPPFSIEVELKHHSAAKPESISVSNIPGKSYDLRIPHRHLHLGNSALSIRKVRDSRGCQSASLPLTPPSREKDGQSNQRVLLSVHSAPSITPLEPQTDYCVGDHVSFSLAGQPPFNVFYTFEGVERKASSQSTTFRRLAEKPGVFTIKAVSDSASTCRAPVIDPLAHGVQKSIHPLPAVRVSKGRDTRVDIHEGGEAQILFEFEGTPPFEFTWTRSSLEDRRTGRKAEVLETRTSTSQEHSLRVTASEEGAYEVVSVRDKWCGVSKMGQGKGGGGRADRLLTY
ncbi:hypothetical protein NA57DRAFT_38409 [Rhizodiscina lignyota]|uniref:Nucleoporin Pom152 n=1 Tax=Rhizodiscina lignyota TaxID=1504668 RepID=A0A9P4M7H7_9PEZI|nr:hypothetical protein NA57DRAFT_38409 [Rhizodiscina lignyota]